MPLICLKDRLSELVTRPDKARHIIMDDGGDFTKILEEVGIWFATAAIDSVTNFFACATNFLSKQSFDIPMRKHRLFF